MKIHAALALGSFVVAASLLSACANERALEETPGTAQMEVETQNALTQNALTQNALTQNALTESALTQNGAIMGALSDPLSREFLKYVVSCALSDDQQLDLTIDGVEYSFQGQLGLAPKWGITGGRCNSECRAWVSGCVLSRVNYLGVPVSISLRGNNSKLKASDAERAAYPNPEAAYYGDVFSYPQKRYACTAPGSTLISRVCGPDYLSGCVMTIVGDCDQSCAAAKQPDGHFPECHDGVRLSNNKYSPEAESFVGSVTVFRQ